MKCPSCQAPITHDDAFCGSCGRRLTAQDKAAAGQTPAPPPMPGPPPVAPPSGGGPVYQQPAPHTYSAPPQQPAPTYNPPPQPVIQPSYNAQAAPSAKKKTSGCLIAVIVIVALLVCGGVIVGGIVLLPRVLPTLQPTAVPTQPISGIVPLPSGEQVPLDVVNNLSVAVCYLYISPSSSDSWGEDWLWDIGWIDPGDSATFWITSGETVDMRAEDCSENLLDEQWGVMVPSEGLTYTLNP